MEDHRCNVRVGVRVRPLSNTELAADSRQVISYPGRDVISIGDGKGDKSFTFDHVFPAHMSQQELYESTAAPMLQSFLDGYNVTVLAYGQTGSGKTFTMGSECGASDDHQGLIPRFVEEIFARVAAPTMESRPRDENSAVVCNPLVGEQPEAAQQLEVAAAAPFATVSFLEIYGEDIFDLLQEPDTEGKTKSLQLREESGAVAVVGLMEVAISESCEAMDMLRAGTRHRTTASTLMNTVSSRSHAVFTITLHQTLFGGAHGEEGQEVVSKLSFVDLAGSERLKRTGAEGQRMKEGIQINKGLLALGNVINALADEEALKKKEKVHVGYRESKLTRLLQDALGGNSQTLFLACVSPAEVNISETLSTLRYANRARNIQNKPVKNTDPLTEELRKLHELNNGLRLELVKEHFHVASEACGDDLQALFDRDDVKAYMEGLNQRLKCAGSSDPQALLRPLATLGAFAAPFGVPPGSMAGTAAALVASARRVSVAHFQKRQSVAAHLHPLPSVGEPSDDAGEKDPGLAQCEEQLDPENDICMVRTWSCGHVAAIR
jgi:kinesin family protein 4/21/27